VTSIDTAAAPSWWRIPKATETVARWHVAPLVDVVAYHFSWLLILVPLALAGNVHPKDYLLVWAIGMTVSFTHRHVTMPYVYLDDAVFTSFKPRLTLIPVVLMCGFAASLASCLLVASRRSGRCGGAIATTLPSPIALSLPRQLPPSWQ
jgi:hypothetical protein